MIFAAPPEAAKDAKAEATRRNKAKKDRMPRVQDKVAMGWRHYTSFAISLLNDMVSIFMAHMSYHCMHDGLPAHCA